MDIFGGQIDPSQFIYRPYKYVADFSLTTLQLLTSQSVTLRGTEMFFAILRTMAVGVLASDGVTAVHWKTQLYTSTSQRYNGSGITNGNDRIRDECFWGTASRPYVLPIAIMIPGSSSILLDLENLASATVNLHLVFDGLQLFPRGQAPV